MSKRLQIRMSKEMYDDLEEYRLENNFEDNSEAAREIFREKFQKNNSFISKLKKAFKL